MGSGVGESRPRQRGSVILAQRARVHLIYRLTGRIIEGLAASRSGSTRRTLPRTALFAAGDVGSAVLLRRSTKFHLGPRLVADAVDTASWSWHPDLFEPAVLPGVPLAVESGVHLGLWGLVTPLVSASLGAVVARHRGQRPNVLAFRWQVTGVMLGVALVAYETNRRGVVAARHEQEVEAQVGLAHLSGQHDVAMGVDSVVDLICRTTPLLDASGCQSLPGRMLARWKQSLAESSSARATYLGVAMARWQHRRNAESPDLRTDVVCEIADGLGSMLLSAHQSGWLDRALDDLPLRGVVRVTVAEPDKAWQPNQSRELLINGVSLRLPAEPGSKIVPFDPGPLGFLAAAMWTLDSLNKETEADPRAVLPVALGQVALAVWADRAVDRWGDESHAVIVRAAVASGFIQTIATTATMRRSVGDSGIQRFPFLATVNVVSMLVTLYGRDLTPKQLEKVAGGLVATSVLGLVLAPKPVSWVDFFSGLLWTMASVAAMARMNELFDEDGASLAAELVERDSGRRREAFATGRGLPLRLVVEAQETMRSEWHALEIPPPAAVAREVERRLDEIDRRIEQIR
jgi:hypothetical protein